MPRTGRPPGIGPLASNPKLVDSVLERMSNGEILTAICAEIGVTHSAFSLKAEREPEFGARYARARAAQAHALAADAVRIADTEKDAAIGRNRIDARKWLAARIDPANYGDKLKQEHSGPDGGPIPMSIEDRRASARALLEQAFSDMKVIEHDG